MALQAGSPAIDAGNAFGLTIDQRGFIRTYDTPGVPDINDTTDIVFEAINAATVRLPYGLEASFVPNGGGKRRFAGSPKKG